MEQPRFASTSGYIGGLALVIGTLCLSYLRMKNLVTLNATLSLFYIILFTFASMIAWEYFSRTKYNKRYPKKSQIHTTSHTYLYLVKSTLYRFSALFLPFYIAYFIIHNHFYFIHNNAFAPTIKFSDYFLIIFLILGPPYIFLTLKYKNTTAYEFNDYGILTMVFLKSIVTLIFFKKHPYALYKNRRVKKILLVYVVNFFFLTLMTRFFLEEFHGFEKHLHILFSDAYTQEHWYAKARNWYFICFHLLFIIDIGIAIIGYSFASRWLDNRTKSVDMTASGWFVALFCYPPFNQLISNNFIYYHSLPTHEIITSQVAWSVIFVLLLLAYSLYVWATMAFGFKFSNLTNRGIISHGPYKYVRHPAYISKNFAWFIDTTYVLTNMWASIAFFTWSSIYVLRALTEERHLNSDKAYLAYKKQVPYRFIPKII